MTTLPRSEVGTGEAYATPEEFGADLQIMIDSLNQNAGELLVRIRLGSLKAAVDIFGFHLATLDMRQSSDIHERILTEIFATAQVEPDYASLSEEKKVELLSMNSVSRVCFIPRSHSIPKKRRLNSESCVLPVI